MDLEQSVRDAVKVKFDAREAFTTADISHPLKRVDPNVRHRHVRAIINQMIRDNELQAADFTTSPITVWPDPHSPTPARLFHPDDPGFDPNSYTARNQQLSDINPVTTKMSGRSIDMSDDDGPVDGLTVITNTKSGHPVTKQCQIQPRQGSINVPALLVRAAGLSTGDFIHIDIDQTPSVKISKAHMNTGQTVDAEGRVRLHGGNVTALKKPNGSNCTAMLVTPPSGEKYIQIQ